MPCLYLTEKNQTIKNLHIEKKTILSVKIALIFLSVYLFLPINVKISRIGLSFLPSAITI